MSLADCVKTLLIGNVVAKGRFTFKENKFTIGELTLDTGHYEHISRMLAKGRRYFQSIVLSPGFQEVYSFIRAKTGEYEVRYCKNELFPVGL